MFVESFCLIILFRFFSMLLITHWFDSNLWQIDGTEMPIYEREREKLMIRSNDVQQLEASMRQYIRDELNEKHYRSELAIILSEKIAKEIRQLINERFQSYKIIIQTYLSRNTENQMLYSSPRFDSNADRCLTILENNGHM